jgi:hypothetical protein
MRRRGQPQADACRGQLGDHGGNPVNQLIAHLLENLILDFQGDLDLDLIRDFLKDDDSKEAKALHARLVSEGGVSDMLLVLADCLKDYVQQGISGEVVREQLLLYVES